MTIPINRKRAKRPKTKTGCRTCRERHLKCDEIRPACARCASTGRVCPGYVLPVLETKRISAVLLPKNVSSIDRGPKLLAVELTSVELHAFEFFRLRTLNQLPGSAWMLSWERLALQVSHREPAVAHAAAALGSLHRAFSPKLSACGGVDLDQVHLALVQYNKAMTCVRQCIATLGSDSSDTKVEVILLMCLLFLCFEILQSEDERASAHLVTGLRILWERKGHIADAKRMLAMSTTPRSNMDVLIQSFVRLDADLTFGHYGAPYLHPVCKDRIPFSFSNLEEAMVHLDCMGVAIHDVTNDLCRLSDQDLAPREDLQILDHRLRAALASAHGRTISLDSKSELKARMHQIQQDLRAWMSALAFLPNELVDQRANLLAHIHFFLLWLTASCWRDKSEMLFDRFEEQFEHIIGLVEKYVGLHSSSSSSSYSSNELENSTCTQRHNSNPSTTDINPRLTLGTSLIVALCTIVFKCRTSALRRRCINVVHTINLQGVYDNDYLVSFLDFVVGFEEGHARDLSGDEEQTEFQCHEIPADARIMEVDVLPEHAELGEGRSCYYKADSGVLIYVVQGDSGDLEVRRERFVVRREARLNS